MGRRSLSVPSPFAALRVSVANLPLTPGVYLMKDGAGTILYIGKAKSLRKRVLSYFKTPAVSSKVAVLMSKASSIDHIDTPTEIDALLLEAHLIRKYQPRYNQELKDDKSFPLIQITGERFPRICVARQKARGGHDPEAVCYGPYTDTKLLRQAVDLINDLFPIRKCRVLPKNDCVYHHIGQCLAPCVKPEVKPAYDRLISEIKRFLGGGKKSFAQYLAERMERASRELRYEDAQFFKNQIDALSKLRKKRFMPKNPGQGITLSATVELKQLLKLEKLPEHIVCFDVSNIQGSEAVASKVSFYRELPDKAGYRRYRIRRVTGINDYAMIGEALERMCHGLRDGREEVTPDLIMIDGGRGHLNTAIRTLTREGMSGIALIAIAKRFERIHSPKFRAPRVLPADSSGLYLLKKIRDEAHRFAITFHRALRSRILRRSVLDDIPGIGKERKRMLLVRFGSVDTLRHASLRDLRSAGVDAKTAHAIRRCLSTA